MYLIGGSEGFATGLLCLGREAVHEPLRWSSQQDLKQSSREVLAHVRVFDTQPQVQGQAAGSKVECGDRFRREGSSFQPQDPVACSSS